MSVHEQQNRSRATHIAIFQNVMQDVSTRRSLSTAEYKVTTRVLLWNDFAVQLERSMSLYQIMAVHLFLNALCDPW